MATPTILGVSTQVLSAVTGPVVVTAPVGTIADSLLLAYGACHNHTTDYPVLSFTETRIDSPVGWTYLGGIRQFLDDLEDFVFEAWYRFIPAASAGSEPVSYSFTPAVYAVEGDLDRGPNGDPLQPSGIIISIVRLANVDTADPIDNVSFDTGGQSSFDPLEEITSTVTYPPVVRAGQALLFRASTVDVLSNFSPSVDMTEIVDQSNTGAPAYEQLTFAISHQAVSTGIIPGKTLTWGNPAHWGDLYVVVRGSGSSPSLPSNWTVTPDYEKNSVFGFFEHRMVASRFDNFIYWINQEDVGINSVAYKANRTTGSIVLQVDLGIKLGNPVAMDVSSSSFYVAPGSATVGSGVPSDGKVRRYDLSFVLQATSADLSILYFFDLLVGKGNSTGKLWVLYQSGVRRLDDITLSAVDEVSPATWSSLGFPNQGVLDKDGNLWIVNSSGVRSWLSFIDGVNLNVVSYEISGTYPGTAGNLTYWEPENSLYVSDSRVTNDDFLGSSSKLGKWSIASHSFTDFFFTDKLIGPQHSGFKYGPSQCVIPLSLSPRSGSYELCLPPEMGSEVVLLCTDNLRYKNSFPLKNQVIFSEPEDPNGLGTYIVEAIFDASQTPDYIWAAFAFPRGEPFKVGFLNTQQTIDCCASVPSIIQQFKEPFCLPVSLKFRGVDRRILSLPKVS